MFRLLSTTCKTFSNSLIIHQVKKKKKQNRNREGISLDFSVNSLVLFLEKINQTLETVFHQLSKHLEFFKILRRCASYFQHVTLLSLFGYPNETLFLVFNIFLPNSSANGIDAKCLAKRWRITSPPYSGPAFLINFYGYVELKDIVQLISQPLKGEIIYFASVLRYLVLTYLPMLLRMCLPDQ